LFKYILVDQVEQMAQGTTIKHLYGKEIIKLNINLPHIDYQTQVIKILSITEKRIRSVQAELEKYDCIKQGMLHDLLARKVKLV
jgi:restriction endonuclease S subunit